MLFVNVPVAVVPAIKLSVRAGVVFVLLHTIPLCVTAAPPSLTIDPPPVAMPEEMLTFVNAAVVTTGAVGGGPSSFLQPVARKMVKIARQIKNIFFMSIIFEFVL